MRGALVVPTAAAIAVLAACGGGDGGAIGRGPSADLVERLLADDDRRRG